MSEGNRLVLASHERDSLCLVKWMVGGCNFGSIKHPHHLKRDNGVSELMVDLNAWQGRSLVVIVERPLDIYKPVEAP